MRKKSFYTTRPNFISFFYFLIIYLLIIRIGSFNKKKTILDFGCGLGYLKKINKKLSNPSKIINYDKISMYSEIKNWQKIKFELIVFCQSAYMLSKKELSEVLSTLRKKNKKVQIITAFSTISKINLLMSKFLGHKNAYTGLKLKPHLEEKIFLTFGVIKKKINFFNLFKIYLLEFK